MGCKECTKWEKKFAKLLRSFEALQKDLDRMDYEYLDSIGKSGMLGRITFGRKK